MFDRALHFSHDGDVLVIGGTVDEHRIADLEEAVTEHLTKYPAGIIEVGEVDFLPSAAIGVLAVAWSRAMQNGDDLVIVAPAGTPAAAALTVSGLPIAETRPQR